MAIRVNFRRFYKRSGVLAVAAGLTVALAICTWPSEIPSLSSSAADVFQSHVRYLASDELTGRGVDTSGIKLARDYLAREFASYGLIPGGDDGTYFQPFSVTTGVAVKQPTSLVLNGRQSLALGSDWIPLAMSASGQVKAELIFVGYGITAKNYGYDDYAGIDAKGKIVLVLRYEPPPKDEKSPFQKWPRYSNYATLRAKMNNARDHGALGMILVDPQPQQKAAPELISLRGIVFRSDNNFIAAQVKREIAERWFEAQGLSLWAVKEKIDREEKPDSTALRDIAVTLHVTLEPIRGRAENVIGILPGSDPVLKNETIVIGAHYDHLGFGYYGSRDSSTEGQIHHGADDNASGTAVLLQVAQRLARLSPRPARTLVFAAFSGEEVGLLGSRHYVEHPTLPLSTTKAMLNLDMVGRLRANRLTVFGARSAEELSRIVNEAARPLGLEINESDAVGRSDHMSFYNKEIPSVHFFTGSHPDYHRPSDTWDKLNTDGMARISDLVTNAAQKIAGTRDPMSFVSLPSRPPAEREESSRGYGAYLGSIPDFAENTEGVRLAGVTDGSPAALAGLREGDIIVGFAGSKVQNLEDLVNLLRDKKPGDEVEIVVHRGGAALILRTTLQARG
jgi:hypothetical protein